MKLFKTNSMPSIEFSREQYNFELPSHQIASRHAKFINSEAARKRRELICMFETLDCFA